MTVAAVLVEIEGVLVDTRDARRQALATALATALAQRGLALDDADLAHAADGRDPNAAAAIAAETLAGRAALDAVDVGLLALVATREFKDTMARGATLIPGARDALAALASRTRVAVVTRAPAAVADLVLSLAELDAVVRVVVTGDRIPAPKPSPAGHRSALARLGWAGPVARERVVALEDGTDGIVAARAAGLFAVGVGGGAHDATQQVTPDAPWVASAADVTYDALVDLLEKPARGT